MNLSSYDHICLDNTGGSHLLLLSQNFWKQREVVSKEEIVLGYLLLVGLLLCEWKKEAIKNTNKFKSDIIVDQNIFQAIHIKSKSVKRDNHIKPTQARSTAPTTTIMAKGKQEMRTEEITLNK